jgi:hypothetical protein
MSGKGRGRSQYGIKSPRIEMLQSVQQENAEEEASEEASKEEHDEASKTDEAAEDSVEEEAEATVEEDTEMELKVSILYPLRQLIMTPSPPSSEFSIFQWMDSQSKQLNSPPE